MKRKRRNPAWLGGTDPLHAIRLQMQPGVAVPRRGRSAKDWHAAREERLQQLVGVDRMLSGEIEYEPEPVARARRKTAGAAGDAGAAEIEREQAAAQTPRRRIARPESAYTRARRLGGISWASWGDPATRTYPGEVGRDWRRNLPGIFRGRGSRGGMKWDELARSLVADGFGPQTPDELTDAGGPERWFVELFSDGDPRDALRQQGDDAAEYQVRALAAERDRVAREQQAYEREQRRAAKRRPRIVRKPKATTPAASAPRRRANPLLLTLHNPASPTTKAAALAAFREFHRTEPREVTRLPGDGPPLVVLGDLVEIVYRPTRGARRGPAFVHKFGAGARVAATSDGRQLVLLPNARKPFRVDWKRGIIG